MNSDNPRLPDDRSADPKRSSTPPVSEEASLPRYVMGIGASAGGLEALERLFYNMPNDTNCAFVIVQHLSPDFKSLMGELLARWTRMTIQVAIDGVSVRPNEIYLMPPKKLMIISGGKLWLKDKPPSDELSLPIDQFFRSLAQDQAAKAIGVILSGTGSDGSRGVRAIHDGGGYVIVQEEESAKFDGMPKSAMETGVVDEVLTPEEIPAALLQRMQDPQVSDSSKEDLFLSDEVSEVLGILRTTFGIDFSLYKPSTVGRRLQRRMELVHEPSLETYLLRLRSDTKELDALYHDLLIGVTRFFRDAAAFHALETNLLPDLIAKTPLDREFRVWVAGCATGEEAYSLAILLHETLERVGRPVRVKIFATDVHRKSIEFAAAGVYPAAALTAMSQERTQRYFLETATGFQVINDIRKLVVFATHNVLKDAPFTKLDLVSCRNLLIYMIPPAQNRILSLFHFGMRTGGGLLLGPSESLGDLADEFETLDSHWKFYRKRRDVRLPHDSRLLQIASPEVGRWKEMSGPLKRTSDSTLQELMFQMLETRLPISILLNGSRQVLHTFGDANRFLRFKRGKPSLDLLELLDSDLRVAVAAAIHRAVREREPVVFSDVRIESEQGSEWVGISVTPMQLARGGETFLLLSFTDSRRRDSDPPGQMDQDSLSIDEVSRERMEILESELQFTKESLQATIEELEASNEELQAINEEMLASNEELQSTNEELHSVNEELYSVNAEYQRKIAELTELTHDMDNLLLSTDVHTIFLDENLCIRKFTPRMGELFHLISADIGRRIEGFMHQIHVDNLLKKLLNVLEQGEVYNQGVMTETGDHFLMRILPYRGEREREGVVMTLVDITDLRKAESRFRNAIEASPSGMLLVDATGKITLMNSECESIFGYEREELIGKSLESLVPSRIREEHRQHRDEYFQAPRVRGMSQGLDVWGVRKDGTEIPLDIRLSPIESSEGPLVLASIIDMTRSKVLESSLRLQVDQRDRFLATLSHELRNPMAAIVSAATLLSRTVAHPETKEPCEIILRQAAQMTTLLDDLLDVSRVTQGKIKLRVEPIDLRDICRESLETVTPMITAHRHQLRITLPETPVFAEVDRGRLLQVVENLLTNASKYTPDAGRIELELSTHAQMAMIRVRDNGRGIAPELLESIFDMFVQSDSTLAHSDGGMGVGLTLVRTLVELHHGKVYAQSEGAGHGSTFVVELPITENRPETPAPSTTERLQQATRVVLIEDNRDARLMLESLLSMDGYEVQSAANGVQGLALIFDFKPQLAVVDIGLPGMDGYEIARRVRQSGNQEIRLIALTGYGREEDRAAVLEAGFNHHLVKPVRIDELEKILNSVSEP
jgi:two-component system, chemotaxis family, CheB/CheR fusion protein